MTNLFAARAQMGMSLGFHIIFASIGIAMPAMMVIAEWLARRTGDVQYRELARRWAKGVAILFAVGAVSGTVLSFELGLLWPRFMQYAGAIIGIPFSLEGFAFFTEAIFLGLYLYGWDRIPARAHQAAGLIVATVKTSPELQQSKDEFAYINEHGKPKPKVELVDDHEWQKIAREAAWGGVR